jgi:hypothetical protein
MVEKRYTIGGTDGWLNVKREPSGVVIAVPEHLQVEYGSTNNGRDYFTILEGVERGNKFSVKSGNLKIGTPGYRAAVNLQFNLTKELITFPGGRVKAVTHTRNPIPAGTYPIQIPDFPHQLGTGYITQSSYAKSWFYLGHGNAIPGNNDRYLHTGSVSAGCLTVDPSGWTKLYQQLILCRRGDGKTVGAIAVVR